ncbi:MAG: hypothetical protein VX589_13865 [Myxococcota bacterium]|nr:hypothetical protein [Myxococcota bacterium]
MGLETRLTGSVTIASAAFERLKAINAFGWRWGEQSIDDYLGQGWTYDQSTETFWIDAKRPMHNHRRFMGILAWFKTGDTTDQLEQQGAVQDAWFQSGRYFIRCGQWGYVGRGTMVVGPESVLNGPDNPAETDVFVWEPAIPPISLAAITDSAVHVELIDGTHFQTPIESLYDLAPLSTQERTQFDIFADRLRFTSERGHVIAVNAEELWSNRRTPPP